MVRRRYGRKRIHSRKKKIFVPLISTGAGLGLFSSLGGPAALNSLMGGNVSQAINDITSAAQSAEAKAKVIGTIGSAVIAKMLLKNMPRNVGKLGPLIFTSG